MPSPGFDDPALGSYPPAGNLYFDADQAVAAKSPGDVGPDWTAGPGRAQTVDLPGFTGPDLMFGAGKYTGQGEPIVHAADQGPGGGNWREVLNFHGSPAPWVLIAILLV